MNDYIYTDYLYHHGIKGMKWGVRRFRRKDGSLTSAGKKRYADDSSDKPTKTSRYDKLYADYKALGHSDKKAAELAKGRASLERSLKIIGGVSVAAIAAYGVYRYYDVNVDRYIKPSQMMQTVHKGDVSSRIRPGNPFYASYTKKDNTIYSSKVFSHFTDESNITRMYTKDGIKVASEKTGRKIFDDLVKTNPEIAEYSKRIGKYGEGRKAYERFNYSLVLRNDSDTAKRMGLSDLDHDKIHKTFYDELKKRGYGAVIDVNDSRREGFTFNPVIVFDDQIKHVVATTKANSKQLGAGQTLKGLAYSKMRRTTLDPTKSETLVLAGTAYLTTLGMTAAIDNEVNKKVEFAKQYRAEHPNTKLTTAKLNKMYEKSLKM